MECTISAFSCPGGRERNEDACGFLEVNGTVCCVLADGAGGHEGGDVASRLCVQSILEGFKARPEIKIENVGDLLNSANELVLGRKRQDEALGDMHSTLVVLLFSPSERQAVWGHVGDSRLYVFRQGSCYFRTRDHSLVQTMVDTGMIKEEDALTHRERNILVSSIGSRQAFSPTLIDKPFSVADGDAFLLCSDGVWGMLTDGEIERALAEATSLDHWLKSLEKKLGDRIDEDCDNYSAIGVWCGEVSGMMRTIPLQ